MMHPKRGTKPHRFDGLSIPAPGVKRKKVARAKTKEATIQAQVEAYLGLRGLAYFHIPDALLKAGFSQGVAVSFALINAAAGVRGFPDLLVFDPKRPGLVLAVELKTEVGKMTTAQRDWQRILGTRLCRSFEEARAVIDGWAA